MRADKPLPNLTLILSALCCITSALLMAQNHNVPLRQLKKILPDETVVQRVGASDPHGKLLLTPGQTIDLDIQVADPAGETGFNDKVKNILTDRYLAARIKVVAGVPVKLEVRNSGETGWILTMKHDGKPIWSHEIDGVDGPSVLLDFEPPKHAFPAGAELGAGTSALGTRGSQ